MLQVRVKDKERREEDIKNGIIELHFLNNIYILVVLVVYHVTIIAIGQWAWVVEEILAFFWY